MIVSLTLLNLLDWGSVGEVEAPSPSVHNIIKTEVGGGLGRGGGAPYFFIFAFQKHIAYRCLKY